MPSLWCQLSLFHLGRVRKGYATNSKSTRSMGYSENDTFRFFFSTFFWSWWQRRCVWNGRIFRADVNCHSYQRCLPVFNDAFKINRRTLRRMTTKNVIIAMVMKWKVWYCGSGTALDCRRAFSCFLFSKDSPRPRHHIPIPRVDVRLCRKKENHHQHLHRMPSRSQ